ncbi:MAG: hypothetical protein INR69_04135 [Mucilaginibacter polytrichastri]|nr:hypothetical protein [Mucilaginibacter polytrichastri]
MRFRALLFVLFSLLILSCRKDPPIYEDLSASFLTSARVDGKIHGSVRLSTAEYELGQNVITIIASLGNNDEVEMRIQTPEVGTFPLGGNSATTAFYRVKQGNSSVNYVAQTGSIVLTKFTDDRVIGTFSFTGRSMNGDEKTITDGKFESEITFDIDVNGVRIRTKDPEIIKQALKKRRSE